MRKIGFSALVALVIVGAPALSFAVCSSANPCGSSGAGRCCIAEVGTAVVCESADTCRTLMGGASNPLVNSAVGVDAGGPCHEPSTGGTPLDEVDLDLQDCDGGA